jgi:hypothetical protein
MAALGLIPGAVALGSSVAPEMLAAGAAGLAKSGATIAGGLYAGHKLYQKYGGNIKNLANMHLHLGNKLRTAKGFIKDRLTSTRGLKKLVFQDIPKVSSEINKGTVLKGIKTAANIGKSAIGAAEDIVGVHPHLSTLKNVLDKGESEATKLHDTLSKYNNVAMNGINSFKKHFY